MIVNIGPILIALGAVVALGERLSRWLIIGALVAFVGVALIGVSTGIAGLTSVGVLWALAAAITYAAGVLFQKPTLRRLPSAQVTLLGCLIGLVVCLPFSGDLAAQIAVAPLSATLGIVYLGVVPTALAFSTWAYALARVPAGQLGISTYLVPPVAIVLALLAFGEIPAPLAIVGGIVCLLGVALSRRRSSPR
jgi:drug/metabolite transporter (DMT)-like permease